MKESLDPQWDNFMDKIIAKEVLERVLREQRIWILSATLLLLAAWAAFLKFFG